MVGLCNDIFNGVFKSVVFGVVVIWILVFEGYDVLLIVEGVLCVIVCIVVVLLFVVLVFDFVFMVLMFVGGNNQ